MKDAKDKAAKAQMTSDLDFERLKRNVVKYGKKKIDLPKFSDNSGLWWYIIFNSNLLILFIILGDVIDNSDEDKTYNLHANQDCKCFI